MADNTDKLADVFGEEFAGQYEETVQQRRRQREKVDEETKKQIAHEAINEGQMESTDEPRFSFTTDEGITHDVILATLPDPENKPIWSHMNELDSGAVTIPLDYLGQWMSCLFNDPEDLKMMEPGEMYVLIGKMDTWQPEDGEPRDQMSPVRGVMDLETINEYAREMMDEVGGLSEEPPEEEDEDEEEEEDEDDSSSGFGAGSSDDDEEDEDDSGSSFFGSGDDEEEEDDTPDVEKSEVQNVIEDTAENHPEVWEAVGSDKREKKVTQLVASKLGHEDAGDDVIEQIHELAVEVINEHNEDDDEDEEEDALF